jgi:hypothetical protein
MVEITSQFKESNHKGITCHQIVSIDGVQIPERVVNGFCRGHGKEKVFGDFECIVLLVLECREQAKQRRSTVVEVAYTHENNSHVVELQIEMMETGGIAETRYENQLSVQ